MTQLEHTTTDTNPSTRPNLGIDIVKRNVKRVLPCKLADEELLRIARMRTVKENEHDQLVADADLDAKKRKAQIKEYVDEILAMRRELHSGYQERTVLTNEVFEKDEKGNYWIAVYRLDTGEPTGERHPASPAEMQRYLPSLDAPTNMLEQAARAQRSAQDAPPDAAVPDGLPSDEDDDGGEDNTEADEEPAETKSKRNGKKGK